MPPSTAFAEPVARPLGAGTSQIALPPQLVHEIAKIVIDTAAAGQVQISEYGALLLALAADGSRRGALLLLKQAIFDAAGKGCYEEDREAVMPLDDASIEETLAQLGYDVYAAAAAPSAEPHVLVSLGASEPADRRCARRGGPSRGLLNVGPRADGSRGSRRSPSRRGYDYGYGYGHRRGVGLTRGMPRALPNVRRGLDVPRRSS
jgi:hypothetical protein